MSELTDRIKGFECYKEDFSSWEATEQIIDSKKAFWCLKKPGSEYQKVCLYRDGCNMFVYGDYGQFTFDSMTWLGDVYNLQYNNFGYQMEKLNYESRKSLYVFDDTACKEDIFEWLKERLENRYDTGTELIDKVATFINNSSYITSMDLEEFCEENNCDELSGIIEFTCECLENTDEYEWISFLRRKSFQEFDEECESDLWNAGKRINQRYFICMYALHVCGEKLKEKQTNQSIR